MDEIDKIIKSTFERKIFDDNSKKFFKSLLTNLKTEPGDLNFLLKKCFDLYGTTLVENTDIFLFDWLRDLVNAINDLKSEKQAVSEVWFSPDDNCSASIINFIKSAQKSLFICVFTISDDSISRQILEKHRLGLDIKIITDNEKLYDKGSDIQSLADAGLKIRVDTTDHHMHHKFAIVDEKTLLTGSYNWTISAAKYNQENLLILEDSFAVKKYLTEFYRLWKTTAIFK